MTSPLSQAPANSPEKEVDLVQDLLCTLDLGLTLAQAAGATTITYVNQDDRRPNSPLKRGYSYSSESDDGGHIHCPDKNNTVFATFSAPSAKRGKRTQK
jgi:hypothetical protein